MNLGQQRVTLFLAEEAVELLQRADVPVPGAARLIADVEETDDLGLWVRIDREDGRHMFLVRWEYVLGVDMPPERRKPMGLKG